MLSNLEKFIFDIQNLVMLPWHQYLIGALFILAGANHFSLPKSHTHMVAGSTRTLQTSQSVPVIMNNQDVSFTSQITSFSLSLTPFSSSPPRRQR
mgnify:CR=1 FL=1